MKKFDLAASMNEVLNSKEYKEMYSASSTIEKLAFNKVSEENDIKSANELEKQMQENIQAKAQMANEKPACEKCKNETKEQADKCVCVCHGQKTASSSDALVKNACANLMKVSEQLEVAGFDKLSELTLMLADRLVSEAKKKPAKKSKDSKNSKDSKKSTKESKDSKDSKKSTKDSKKESKKSSK